MLFEARTNNESAIRFNPNWRFVSDERQIRLHELMRNEFGNNDSKRGQIGYKSIRNDRIPDIRATNRPFSTLSARYISVNCYDRVRN